MKKTTSIIAAASALALGLTLAACDDDSSGKVEKGGATASAPAASKADKAEKTEAAQPKFGDAYEFKTGLKVSISQPESFKPSEYASVEDDGDPVVFTITVTNGSEKAYDPIEFIASAASGGAEASEVFDDTIGDAPTTKVQPGKSVTWKAGYTVKDPADITMDVTPEMTLEDDDEVTFSN